MISSLRNKKKLITFSLWFIIAAFVGTIFFVWGVGDQAQQALYAAKVDGVTITDQDFRDKVESTKNQFRSLFGDNVNDILSGVKLEKSVMENLINEALLRNEAVRLELPVSDAEIATNIQSIQAFQTDGKFDPQLYVQLLSRNRLTPQIFEESLKQDITLKKMEDLIKQSVAVTDKEIEKEYIYRDSEATIRYLELTADNFIGDVKITDEALNAFYEEHKAEYEVPTKADFKYVIFDPENYKAEFKATDKEIENFFIKNKASFVEAEKLSAAHILLKVDNWSDEIAANEVYKKAKDIKAQIDAGKDFAAMAKKYSQDGTAETGGELGYFTRGQMVPEFEKVAFATKPGTVSDVVKTQFGFHLIKVIDYKPETDPVLDDVRDQITATIIDQKSQSSFRTYVFDIYRALVNKSNITAYNLQSEDKLVTNEIKGLSAKGDVEPLIGLADVAKKILSINKSEISQVLEVKGRKMVFEMTEKYDAYIPALADIKEKVTAHFVKVKSLELAQQKADEAAKLTSMDEAANMLNKNYTTTPKFKRSQPITGLGLNEKLMTDIFRASPEQFIQEAYTIGNKVFIVQVKEIVAPDVKAIGEQVKEQIKSQLYGTKSAQAVASYVLNLKTKAKISINPRYAEFYN